MLMINLLWLIIAGLVGYYWWNSWKYKGRALGLALEHCGRLNLQLLDQSMVIRGIRPERNASGNLDLRRTYQFEFTSTGEQRYRGMIILSGMELMSIDFEAYKIPGSD